MLKARKIILMIPFRDLRGFKGPVFFGNVIPSSLFLRSTSVSSVSSSPLTRLDRLSKVHDHPRSGDGGFYPTYRVLKRCVEYKNFKSDGPLFVKSFPFCQCSKPDRTCSMGFLRLFSVPRSPCGDLVIDIWFSLPPLGKCLAATLAVLVDRFLGYMFSKIFLNFPTSKSFFLLVRNSCLQVFCQSPIVVCPTGVSSSLLTRGENFWAPLAFE
jgi:hypothetical protein